MRRKGFFLTLEGTDGVGKSTQARLLARWFRRQKVPVVLTREPGGGGNLARAIRRLLLHSTRVQPLSELFLYEAARAEHVANVIRPALENGCTVICDRFIDATEAYQGFARKLPNIRQLNRWATQGLLPDLTVLLTMSPRVGLTKARRAKGKHDRMEREGVRFQERVLEGYRAVARREPGRVVLVPVESTVRATQEILRTLIMRHWNGHSRSNTRRRLSR